jgi:hypothetical protein
MKFLLIVWMICLGAYAVDSDYSVIEVFLMVSFPAWLALYQHAMLVRAKKLLQESIDEFEKLSAILKDIRAGLLIKGLGVSGRVLNKEIKLPIKR